MKLKFFALFFALSATTAFAWSPQKALEISKQRFESGFDAVFIFLQDCRNQAAECGWQERQSRLASSILYELIREGQPKLVFVSERENPGTFLLDGQVRIAKTGSLPKDDIFINTDLITRVTDGVTSPFELEEVVVTLIHELGHHHHDAVPGPVTHEELDLLGNNVRTFMSDRKTTLSITKADVPELGENDVVVSFYNSEGGQNASSDKTFAFLTGEFGSIDISNLADKRLTCPTSTYIGELDFKGDPFFFFLKTFQFNPIAKTATGFSVNLTIDNAAAGCINRLPDHPGEFRYFKDYKNGQMKLPFVIEAGKVTFDEPKAEFQMTKPRDEVWN